VPGLTGIAETPGQFPVSTGQDVTPGPLPESRLRPALWGPSKIKPLPSSPLNCLQTTPTHTLPSIASLGFLAAVTQIPPTHRKSGGSETTQGWIGKLSLCQGVTKTAIGQQGLGWLWRQCRPHQGFQSMLLALSLSTCSAFGLVPLTPLSVLELLSPSSSPSVLPHCQFYHPIPELLMPTFRAVSCE
jgi:hypothetical protein